MTEQAKTYLLDANVFIEAKNHYYAFDLCPGFWESLLSLHEAGFLLSIDKVKAELLHGKDELAEWVATETTDTFFASSDEEPVIAKFSELVRWVNGREQFLPEAKAEFMAGVDGWLIAYAAVHGLTLVTHEQFRSEVKRKVPIPNACRPFGVRCEDTFRMLKAMNISFTSS